MDSPNFAQSLDNDDSRIGHMFVVGGFAESAILQESLRSEFGYKMNVIIPQVCTRIFSIKFMFSKKATKIDRIFIDGENFVKFCDLLRKHKLYK